MNTMTAVPQTAWQPRPDDLQHSGVAQLMRRLGFDDYDRFYQYSIDNPEAYWREVNRFCQFVWSRPFDQYKVADRGLPFTRWFSGGELNWVDSALQWAHDPASAQRLAIVAERETGAVEQVTYAELERRVRSFAAGLRQQGIGRGDRVGLLMENGIEANVTVLALSYIGAIVVPLFSGFGVDAIVARLLSCEARAIIATTGFSRRSNFVDVRAAIEGARTQLPTVASIIWKASPEGAPLQPDDLDWYALAAQPALTTPAERMSAHDPFMVIYTSGTTGKPKGPVHTHGGFPLKIAHDAAVHFDIRAGDVLCWPADMGWIAGSLVSASAFMRGATLVTYDGAPDYPDWSRMAGLIERHRVTHYGCSPTLIRGLAAHPDDALRGDMASLRLMITAGESIDPEHFNWLQSHFGDGHCPIINYTGGTEVSGGILSSVVVKPIPPGGFNTPSPSLAVDVVDASGRSLTNEIGELAIRAPFVGMTQSFWQDDARYLDTYWSTVPDMWLHGDLAIRNEDGTFFILGRSDDTIKVAGKRLGPAEVEEILLELDEVAEVAAVGAQDSVKGQKLIVFVVPAAGWSGQPQGLCNAIANRVATRLGKPFRPAEVFLMAQLPKTRSGKVMRRVIRNAYAGLPYGDMSALDNPAALAELQSVVQTAHVNDAPQTTRN